MKKILFWKSMALVALISVGCTPGNEYGGKEDLQTASFDWFPYESNNKIVFTNANGDSLVFQGGTKTLKYDRQITACDGGTWNSGGCIETDLQRQSMNFSCSNPNLSLSCLLSVKKTNETRWDILRVGLLEESKEKTFFAFDVTQTGISNSHESFFYADSAKIAGRTFAEVLRNKTSGAYNVYFNKTQGVVGFKLSDGSEWAKK